MATNFATDPLKSVMSKAVAGPTNSVTTTDSAVAEVRTHQPLHQESQDATGGTAPRGVPTLSDSAVAELKAAYVAVEDAIAEAKAGTTGGTTSEKPATDKTATHTETSGTEATNTDSGKNADSTTHQPPDGPLVKVLADATGETTATVQGVLQQVRAVLHQEHSTDASGDQGATDTAASGAASTPAVDAKPGDPQHWHDRLIAQHDGYGSADPTNAGGQGGADAGSTLWQHFLNHYAAADSTVTTDPGVVMAVDGFVDTVQSLHLDNGPGQMHGHGTDGTHLDTAA